MTQYRYRSSHVRCAAIASRCYDDKRVDDKILGYRFVSQFPLLQNLQFAIAIRSQHNLQNVKHFFIQLKQH